MSVLLFRADANPEMGTGHVMRCRSLAQEWTSGGGSVEFATLDMPPALRERLASEGFGVSFLQGDDAADTIDLARDRGAAMVVIDGYQFDDDYQKDFADAEIPTLVVDDHVHADAYFCDLLLNQNVYADESMYPRRASYTRMLLGTSYAMLRREFAAYRGWSRTIPERARRVLISLGGADPGGLTARAVSALSAIHDRLEIFAVLGGAASSDMFRDLETLAASSPHEVAIFHNVREMAGLMAEADLAISAGGTTNWELAFMGLPNIVLVLAENQRRIAESLHARGASLNIGDSDQVTAEALAAAVTRLTHDRELRLRMSEAGRQLVDGFGTTRVVGAIEEAVSASSVSRK